MSFVIASLAVVLTVHNRREKTLACLGALHDSAPAGVRMDVVLVDDGSSDGTADAVRSAYPMTRIIVGTGDLFWNQGMRLGLGRASALGADALVWLNDDTYLDPDALGRLLAAAAREPDADFVLAATVRDPDSGAVSYGGRVRSRWINPLHFDELLRPDSELTIDCEAFNGNLVLVPMTVFERVGNLADAFRHERGDIEYGMRARSMGVRVRLAPGSFGVCRYEARSPVVQAQRPFCAEMRSFATDPKRAPLAERIALFRAHAPWWFWPALPAPYLKHAVRYLTAPRHRPSAT